MDGENVIPAPLDDDDDDVAWALQTAAVQWQRGARADAVVWVRRAVDAAIASGSPERTKDLTRLAASVADRLVSEALAAPDSMIPPSPGGSVPADDVDALLAAEPSLPPPVRGRGSAHSLTGEISVDFEDDSDLENDADVADVEDDEFDDQSPTIPPPSGIGAPVGTEGPDPVRPPPPEDEGGQAGAGVSAWPQEPTTDVSDDEVFSARLPARAPSVLPVVPFGSLPPQQSAGAGADEPFGSMPPASAASAGAPSSLAPAPPEPDPLPIETDHVGGQLSEAELAAPAPIEAAGEELPGIRRGEGAAASAAEGAPEPAPLDDTEAPPLPDEAEFPAGAGEAGAATSTVDGVALEEVRGFEDLPEETQLGLARSARVTQLSLDEEVGSFGAALVTRGRVGIMPAISEVAASVAVAGEVVFTHGTLDDGIPLRVVALEDDTAVASWSAEDLQASMAECPWVADELRLVADRFQALAGATLGPLGDRLDDALRDQVVSRLDVKAFAPGEVIVEAGKPVPGLHVVGAGRVELASGDAVTEVAEPGDFLFAAEVLAGGRAHATARAGKTGALILFATRGVAHELLMIVPPLLEILGG
jgi:hypothetical protein